MEANSEELNLGFSCSNHFPNSIPELLKTFSPTADLYENSIKLNAYIQVLEEELKKIRAFKCELPLCILLLEDAIKKLKEEMMLSERTEIQPAMKDFIHLKGNSEKHEDGKLSSDFSDKKNWLSSARLWSTGFVKCEDNEFDIKIQGLQLDLKLRDRMVEDGSAIENPKGPRNLRNRGGAFVPFRAVQRVEAAGLIQGDLMAGLTTEGKDNINSGSVGSGSGSQPSVSVTRQTRQNKKQRRCWSSELHQRFVEALQRHGGPYKATPKHIRETMQMDGLTNDEVKSHLQKYRLHIRKFTAS